MKRLHFIPLVLLSIILLMSFFLRVHQFATWPRQGATFDEFAWTWLGMSLLKDGIPQSWSFHPQYNDTQQVKIQGADFILVKPYLEHPPFFGIVAGAFALATGQREFSAVKLSTMRILPIALGMASVVLVYTLATLLYGPYTGVLAGAVYGMTPTVAVGSRLVQNENFFIPLWLLMLIILKLYLDKKRLVYKAVLGIVGGLLILTKIPWIAGILSVSAILWLNKRTKDALFVLIISCAVGSLYVVYGLLLDSRVFTGLMGLQLNRYDISFVGLFSLWLKPLLADRYYVDGWIYFGWMAFFILGRSFKKHQFLILAVLSYGFIYLLGIPDEPGHGWYRFPFYPFLAIASAVVIREHVFTNPFYRAVFLLIVGLPLLATSWGAQYGFSMFLYRAYILWSVISFLPWIVETTRSKRFSNLSFYAQSICIFFLTAWSVLGYNEQ